MDRGGGGGKTPRRKSRGRGSGRDSSPRTPASSTPFVEQSPTVSSSSSDTPTSSERSNLGSDKRKRTAKQKGPQPTKAPLLSTMSSDNPPTAEVSPESEETLEVAQGAVGGATSESTPPEDVLDKDTVEKQEDDKIVPPEPSATESDICQDEPDLKEDIGQRRGSLQEPVLPERLDSLDRSPETTESKVAEALKTQPRPTAKVLVVTPPTSPERPTEAPPLVIEIERCETTTPTQGEGGRPVSAASQARSSRSVSPSFAYALHGPIGKPGVIGGVGFTDDEESDGGDRHNPVIRRASAIAAVETALKRFTKRQWIMLIIFGVIDLLSAVTISLQAPFYPAEAERKGATPTEYGFVFGIFEFIIFLTAPIYGKFMGQLGPKRVFNTCILITSISVICFGLLDRINDHTTFITLCFVCRIFEALGCGGFFTATFTIMACEFPETIATTFASLETFFGLGMIVGPSLGGALYDLGGFPLPFFTVGTCLLITAFLSSFFMPKMDTEYNTLSEDAETDNVAETNQEEEADHGILTILKIPSVALSAISIATTSLSLGFVSATLEPHIRRFELTPLQTGLVFMVNGGVYALTAPVFGVICDYISRPSYIIILGNAFIFLAFLLIGPAAFMPFDTILWVTIIGLVIQGLGFSCCLVAGFIVGLRDSMKHGFPDNLATYGVASGLWTSMISLGAWIGPSISGVLYDRVGFREGSWLVLATALSMGFANLSYVVCSRKSTSSGSESQPLLRSIPPLLGKKDADENPKQSLSYGSMTEGGETLG